jgi:peptide/nickel transport system ATP-binding protein
LLKLKVSGLKAYYFTENGIIRGVDGVNFEITEGESLGIVGESACGKSTLAAALMQSIQSPGRIVEGSIILGGADITKMSSSEFDSKIRWKKIAMVFQGAMNALDPVYTVESQLREILREQRVVIAMALLLDPDILIADEPTTALDMLVQSQIIGLLKKLQKEKGVSIILITHDLALVSQITDKIAIMYAGQLVEVSSTSDIYNNPRHPYTQALIKAIPKLRTEDKEIHFVKGSPPPLLNPPRGCRFYDRCIHAMDVCKRNPLEFETETGYVRCWLHDGSGENPQP